MRFNLPSRNTKRLKKKFAWLPKKLDNENIYVWLESYYVMQRYGDQWYTDVETTSYEYAKSFYYQIDPTPENHNERK
jgi:HEPN domain-containing protein